MKETKFKQTEIGEIPEDWEVKRVGDFSFTQAGGTPSALIDEYWNGDIRWMNSGELNLKRVYEVEGRITELGVNNSSTHIIPKQCVLIGLAGQGKTRGTAAINYVELCTNQSIGAIYPSYYHNSEYLYHYIDSQYKRLREISDGGGGRGGLNLKLINDLLIPLPPLDEQERIAEALSDVDGLLRELDGVIAKKRAIKQGTMQELLTGKRRLEGFAGEWEEKMLGNLGKFVSGNGFPLSYQGNKEGDLPFYKVSDFSNNKNDCYLFEANHYISKETSEILHCNIIPKDSIVFAKIGAAIFLERKRLTSRPCCIDNNMMSFQMTDLYDKKFFLYVFKTILLGDLVSATALPALKTKDLQECVVFIPNNKEEQTAIANILSDMDEEIAAMEAKRAKYEQVKQGMMQELLTGRIRLINN